MSVTELDKILRLVQIIQVLPVVGFIGNGCEVAKLARITVGGFLCQLTYEQIMMMNILNSNN